jgi:tRNA(His) 5'-end guanylyltransferase
MLFQDLNIFSKNYVCRNYNFGLQYNTVFWTLVQKGGLTNQQSQDRLKGTFSNDKNEILFSQFGINYNNEPEQFKKGTTLYRKRVELPITADDVDKVSFFLTTQ